VSKTTPEEDELERPAEDAELRRRYRASSLDEPPAALDSAIRAAARRAVKAHPRLAGSPFGGSWRVPLSIAAVLVVSATVTLMVAEHDSYLPSAGQGTAPSAKPVPEAERGRGESAPASQPAKDRADAVPAEAAASSAAPLVTQDARDTAAPKTQEKDTAPAPQTVPVRGADRGPQQGLPAAAEPERRPVSPSVAAGARSALSGNLAPSTAAALRKSASQVEPSADQLAMPKDELVRQSSPAESKAKDAGSLHDAPVQPASPSPAASGSSAARVPAPAPVQAAEEAAPLRSDARKEAEFLGQSDAEAAGPWTRDPRAWLEHIKQLQAADRFEQAKASFKAFRARFPDYPLPAGFVVPAP
jgi:hypothetical protein